MRDLLPDMKKNQKENKIVRKGSICEFCNDLDKDVKLKEHPKTNEPVIICRACYSMLWLKENPKK